MTIYFGPNGPQSPTGVYQQGDVYWDISITHMLSVFVYDTPYGWLQLSTLVDSVVAGRRFFVGSTLPITLIYGDIFLDSLGSDVKMWDNISWISISSNNRSLQPSNAAPPATIPTGLKKIMPGTNVTAGPPVGKLNYLLRQIFEGISPLPSAYSHQDLWWGDISSLFSFLLIYDVTKGSSSWAQVNLTNFSVVAGVQFYPTPDIQTLSHISFNGGDVWIETHDGINIDDVLIWDDIASFWFQPNSNRIVHMYNPFGHTHQTAAAPQAGIPMSSQHSPSIVVGGPLTSYLTINNQIGNAIVEIDSLGNITYGPSYTPDAAAKIFWETISAYSPATIAQTENVALKEANADLLKRLEKYEPSVPTGMPPQDDDAYSRAMKIIK